MITSRLKTMPPAARLLAIIIAVSVAVRLGSALFHGPSIQPLPGVTDQVSYHELAIRVLNGHGFSFATGWWPATRANQPTAHWSFLYVLFLTAVYSVFGVAPLAARIIQALIVGVLHPLLVWRIGSRVFSPAVGLVSAGLTAVYGYFVFYAGALVTESLYFVGFLWALDIATAIALSSRARASRVSGWMLLGLAFGATALLRQAFLLVVPVILGWTAWRVLRRREADGRPLLALGATAVRVAAVGAVTAACILPWTVRNYRAFDQLVLLNTNAGYVLFYGAHPVHGTRFIPIMPDGSASYQALLPRGLRRLNEAQIERVLLVQGLGFVQADPLRYLRLCVSRASEFVKFWPSSDSSLASNVMRVMSFGVVLPFFLVGAFLALTSRNAHEAETATLFVLVATGYALVHLMTWTLVRYRLPIDAMAMPLAGLALVAIASKVRSAVRTPDAYLRTSAS